LFIDQTKKKLEQNVPYLLDNELTLSLVLREVILHTRYFYEIGPYRKPYSDLESWDKDLKEAEYWKSIITTTTGTAGTIQLPLDDPLPELAAQANFEDHVAMFTIVVSFKMDHFASFNMVERYSHSGKSC
jgi:hypothetical protein